MSHLLLAPIMVLTLGMGTEHPIATTAARPHPASPRLAQLPQPNTILAAGTFTQTAITSLQAQQAGPNTILQQTSQGSITGTVSGTFTDSLRVVIHPSGSFNTQFTLTCHCTVDGRQGVLTLEAADTGQMISPTLAGFAGRAVITAGTGQLSGLRGVLDIVGVVDLTTGLSSYSYAGLIFSAP